MKINRKYGCFFYGKKNFINIFQAWFPGIEGNFRYLLKALSVDIRSKFILIKPKTHCQ